MVGVPDGVAVGLVGVDETNCTSDINAHSPPVLNVRLISVVSKIPNPPNVTGTVVPDPAGFVSVWFSLNPPGVAMTTDVGKKTLERPSLSNIHMVIVSTDVVLHNVKVIVNMARFCHPTASLKSVT